MHKIRLVSKQTNKNDMYLLLGPRECHYYLCHWCVYITLSGANSIGILQWSTISLQV